MSALSRLPAVHRILDDPALAESIARHGRLATRNAVREALAAARTLVGTGGAAPDASAIASDALDRLAGRTAPAYAGVINATGVLIHTNLGRAPRLQPPLSPYLALEMELGTGERGERLAPVVTRLLELFGSEAATVVTNNAAALVLLLAAHAAGREVIVSRGELVEIGGSFRLPEIMAAAGARLVEVGCTNRTREGDFEAAIGENTAAILVVHRSNFHMSGFVETPALDALVALGRRRGVPVWVDQGSGCLLDLAAYGLQREATVSELLTAGADAVLFSGDKLLGGPQAGIVVGTASAIAPLRRHPLRRALRPDKTALVALAATLDAFLAGRPQEVPLYRLLATAPDSLRRRARRIAAALGRVGAGARAVASRAALGGGTTPGQTLPSWAVELPGENALADRLRRGAPPVVARVEGSRLLADLRAVFPEQDRDLTDALILAASQG